MARPTRTCGALGSSPPVPDPGKWIARPSWPTVQGLPEFADLHVDPRRSGAAMGWVWVPQPAVSGTYDCLRAVGDLQFGEDRGEVVCDGLGREA